MTDVFISYSRADQAFVKVLHQALTKSQYDAWVDWEDIPLTADWWREIQAGIEAADTFIFVISPDSIASKVCRQEIDYAAANHKRFMPIVRREGFSRQDVSPFLSRHNWLFFRETDEFDTAFQSLIKALDTDLDAVKFHTRLLVRAKEWDTKGKTEDLLLRGNDLDTTETWLSRSVDKFTRPTALQQDFVYRSRQAETTRQQQARRRLQLFAGSVAALALVALGAAGVAFQQRQKALTQGKMAFANQLVVEAERASANQSFRQKLSIAEAGVPLAFGLDRLPPAVATQVNSQELDQLVFSGQETYVAAVNNLALRGWELNTQQEILNWDSDAKVVDVGFSPDEQLVAVATQDGMLHVWRFDPTVPTFQKNMNMIQAHAASLTDAIFSPDGSLLATGSEDGSFKIWSVQDILNPSSRMRTEGRVDSGQPIRTLAFSPDSQSLMIGSDDGTVRAFSLDNQPIFCIDHGTPVRLVRFNSDRIQPGTQLGSVSGMTTVRLWSWPALLKTPTKFEGVFETCPD